MQVENNIMVPRNQIYTYIAENKINELANGSYTKVQHGNLIETKTNFYRKYATDMEKQIVREMLEIEAMTSKSRPAAQKSIIETIELLKQNGIKKTLQLIYGDTSPNNILKQLQDTKANLALIDYNEIMKANFGEFDITALRSTLSELGKQIITKVKK